MFNEYKRLLKPILEKKGFKEVYDVWNWLDMRTPRLHVQLRHSDFAGVILYLKKIVPDGWDIEYSKYDLGEEHTKDVLNMLNKFLEEFAEDPNGQVKFCLN